MELQQKGNKILKLLRANDWTQIKWMVTYGQKMIFWTNLARQCQQLEKLVIIYSINNRKSLVPVVNFISVLPKFYISITNPGKKREKKKKKSIHKTFSGQNFNQFSLNAGHYGPRGPNLAFHPKSWLSVEPPTIFLFPFFQMILQKLKKIGAQRSYQ